MATKMVGTEKIDHTGREIGWHARTHMSRSEPENRFGREIKTFGVRNSKHSTTYVGACTSKFASDLQYSSTRMILPSVYFHHGWDGLLVLFPHPSPECHHAGLKTGAVGRLELDRPHYVPLRHSAAPPEEPRQEPPSPFALVLFLLWDTTGGRPENHTTTPKQRDDHPRCDRPIAAAIRSTEGEGRCRQEAGAHRTGRRCIKMGKLWVRQ